MELDTPGAFRFLKETGPLLSGAGFGVLLPDWVRKARLGLKLTTRSRSTPASAGAAAARFGLGDAGRLPLRRGRRRQALDPDELAELARLKIPLVRLRGQWVELDDAHLKAALKFLERTQAGTMSAADALAAGLGLDRATRGPDEEVPLVGVDADGWLGDLLSGQADRRLQPMTAPGGLLRAAAPLPGARPVLAVLPGPSWAWAASWPTTWAWARRSSCWRWSPAQPPGVGPTLLVCPMSLVGNWQREAARFTPGPAGCTCTTAPTGCDGESLAAALAGADLVHHHLRVAARDQAALGAGELGPGGAATRRRTSRTTPPSRPGRSAALPAAARIALTGTPVENRLSELWSIMEFANPGLLGPAERFRERYAVPIERHGDADAAARAASGSPGRSCCAA